MAFFLAEAKKKKSKNGSSIAEYGGVCGGECGGECGSYCGGPQLGQMVRSRQKQDFKNSGNWQDYTYTYRQKFDRLLAMTGIM